MYFNTLSQKNNLIKKFIKTFTIKDISCLWLNNFISTETTTTEKIKSVNYTFNNKHLCDLRESESNSAKKRGIMRIMSQPGAHPEPRQGSLAFPYLLRNKINIALPYIWHQKFILQFWHLRRFIEVPIKPIWFTKKIKMANNVRYWCVHILYNKKIEKQYLTVA